MNSGTPRVIGVYIDLDEAEALADARVCLVARTPSGKIMLLGSEPGSPVAAIWQHFTADDLAAVIASVAGRRVA